MSDTCADCRYWKATEPSVIDGKCHRYPPTIVGDDHGDAQATAFPDTQQSDWCGEHTEHWHVIIKRQMQAFTPFTTADIERAQAMLNPINGATEFKPPETPQFVHDCDKCVFLGRWTAAGEPGRKYDLYYADHGGLPDTVIARHGDEGSQYISGLPLVGLHPGLTEAKRRAVEHGLMKESAS